MKIAIASDKTGAALKDTLLPLLERQGLLDGFTVVNAGAQTIDEWPGVAYLVAKLVSSGAVDRGILICGTGMGMAMMANKVKGAYAAVCKDPSDAIELVESKGGNVLVLGCFPFNSMALTIALTFIDAPMHSRPNAQRMRELEARQ
jgi:ribose 5-phosphate isomerase B